MTTTLTPVDVESIFADCLFRDGEDTTDRVEAEGIVHSFGFHPARLESHRQEVAELLAELPNEFQDSSHGGGGGWSFLNACEDRHGRQWTGVHLVMEQLITLGVGLGLVVYCLPREYWKAFPGEVPYFYVKVEE